MSQGTAMRTELSSGSSTSSRISPGSGSVTRGASPIAPDWSATTSPDTAHFARPLSRSQRTMKRSVSPPAWSGLPVSAPYMFGT